MIRNSIRFAALSLIFICSATTLAQEKKPAEDWITPETRKAIKAGLEYLAKSQADDGSWGTGPYQGSPAITGFAGLAFLANHKPGKGPPSEVVVKAVEYILKQEDPDRPGFLKAAKGGGHGPMYQHGFAVLFLAEAYPKAGKDLQDRIKPVLTRSVKLMTDSQNREGGWRYQPRPLDADLTMTCCQLHALCAAQRLRFRIRGFLACFHKLCDRPDALEFFLESGRFVFVLRECTAPKEQRNCGGEQ